MKCYQDQGLASEPCNVTKEHNLLSFALTEKINLLNYNFS